MSTNNPIPSDQCGTCTSWLRCKLAALTCKLQTMIEPLCETNPDGSYTLANKIGMTFAYGTSCPCCLGFRTVFALAFAALGWVLFFIK